MTFRQEFAHVEAGPGMAPLRYTPPEALVFPWTGMPRMSRQMEFPHIVALIDARIALLEQVRRVLARPAEGSRPAARRVKKRSLPATPASSPSETKPLSSAIQEVKAMPAAPPEPVRLPFVAPRERSSSKEKAAVKGRSALAGHLPSGPVVVAAARVQAEEAQRRTAERNPVRMQDEKSPEPDQILRRWREQQQTGTA